MLSKQNQQQITQSFTSQNDVHPQEFSKVL